MTLGGMIKKIKANEDNLVTPRILDYLTKSGGNPVYDQWVVDRIAELMVDESNSVRHSRFGASSRGTCTRRQVYAYLGTQSLGTWDPILHNIFNDGHWRHMRWQAMGLQTGTFTDVETKFQRDEVTISMDGVNTDEGWLFELKGARYIPEAIPEAHMLQIHTYFWASGYEKCSYVVEDKRSQDWKEWVVTPDPAYMKAVEEEIHELTTSVTTQKFPPILPACKQKEGPYKRCPYSEICLEDGPWPA